MQYKFTMDAMAEDIRIQFAEVIGRQYLPDILIQFGYSTIDGEDRSCLTLLNSTSTDIYTANMMVAEGDERDCLCLYSPFRSRLDRSAKRGYAIFDRSKPMGRNTLGKNQQRTPHCVGCQLTIREMKVSIIIKMLRANSDILSKKEKIIEFMKKVGKEAKKEYGVHVFEARFTIEAKGYMA